MFHYKNLYHPQQRQSRLMGALARPKDYISKGPPEQIIPRHHSSKKERDSKGAHRHPPLGGKCRKQHKQNFHQATTNEHPTELLKVTF